METLKREEIYANDYRDLEHLIESVETRSPWGETELKLLEVKGLGQPTLLG